MLRRPRILDRLAVVSAASASRWSYSASADMPYWMGLPGSGPHP